MPIECNTAHSKGLAFYCKEESCKHMSYAEMKTTEFKLTLIAEHARRDKSMQFMSLAHLLNAEYLKDGLALMDEASAPPELGLRMFRDEAKELLGTHGESAD